MNHPPLFADLVERLHEPLRRKTESQAGQAATFFQALEQAPDATPTIKEYNKPVVTIGCADDMPTAQQNLLHQALDAFRPWRKGPFSLFGTEIDAEWRSDFKWDRISPLLGDLSGKSVCDVGCGNGYFMYRMLAHNPRLVLGLDPTWRYYANFLLFQKYAREDRLQMLPLGWQELSLLPGTFDVLLAMGIVYHHRDPVTLLEQCRHALTRKGLAIIESMTIPGEEPLAWSPGRRYANVGGVWFVPSAPALEVWLTRAGFRNITRVSHIPLSTQEQRRTPWADVPSFAESLTPDGKQTIEGFPPPWRTIFTATR